MTNAPDPTETPAESPSDPSTPDAQSAPDPATEVAPDPVPARTTAQILKTAGPFKPQTITIANRRGEPTQEPARVVGGIVAVHKGTSGWMVSHAASGYGACQSVSSKVVAEKIARMLAVIDPVLYSSPNAEDARALGDEQLDVEREQVKRIRIAAMIRASVLNPHHSDARLVNHLLAHPVGSEGDPDSLTDSTETDPAPVSG
ncbi:MAG: hypothetical protein WKF57_03925 [Nakamurella sp.]